MISITAALEAVHEILLCFIPSALGVALRVLTLSCYHQRPGHALSKLPSLTFIFLKQLSLNFAG